MSLPPRRMFDVWADPDYDFAETKPERLLLAALDYSIERFVVYVAAKPPRSIFRNIAARFGRTIVYIPIGQLIAGHAEEDPRGARARWLRQARERQGISSGSSPGSRLRARCPNNSPRLPSTCCRLSIALKLLIVHHRPAVELQLQRRDLDAPMDRVGVPTFRAV